MITNFKRTRFQFSEQAERTATLINLIRERMTKEEVDRMFERQWNRVRIKKGKK